MIRKYQEDVVLARFMSNMSRIILDLRMYAWFSTANINVSHIYFSVHK